MITTRRWSVFITILLPVIVTISLLSWLETKSHAGEAEMHHPQGWRFTMPKGDATKGREAFEKFACYVCHEVRGEKFPAAAPGSVLGPELSQMGPLHPLEFFSESSDQSQRLCCEEIPRPRRRINNADLQRSYDSSRADRPVELYCIAQAQRGGEVGHVGVGKVIALVPESQEIVVDHEEIKGFMDAMTMGYKVNPTSLLKGRKARAIQFASRSTPTSA